MSRSNRQRRLFVDNGPSWSSLSDEQRNQIVDLLAELLVAQLAHLHAIVSVVQHEPEENLDG
jgi:hypothetical protein